MDWLVSILVGALAGWLASMIMKRDGSMGAIANIIVGIIGGAIGNFVAAQAGIAPVGGSLSIGGVAISVLGAVILLWIIGLVTRK